jgi:hypothetical protein
MTSTATPDLEGATKANSAASASLWHMSTASYQWHSEVKELLRARCTPGVAQHAPCAPSMGTTHGHGQHNTI